MCRMAKKITTVLHVRIDGKYYLLDELPEEKRKKILAELNDRGMRSIGYVPVGKKSDSA